MWINLEKHPNPDVNDVCPGNRDLKIALLTQSCRLKYTLRVKT